jgi:Ca-activated chloride channel family protein
MSFDSPLYLLALLAVPLVVALYVVHHRRRSRVAARFASPSLLPNVVDRSPGRRRHVPPAILLIALSALLVGMARPKAQISVPREDATIMLAVDTSRSMAAKDVLPTRMDAARNGLKEFLAAAPDTYRVGVVSFASDARVVAPPTRDRGIVELALNELRTGEGTALGDAIAMSIEVGQAAGQRSRKPGEKPTPTTVLVVSDGKEDGGDVSPAQASQLAQRRGVPVYAIAMGTREGVVEVPLAGGYSARVEVPAAPDTLRGVSRATGGKFFTAPSLEQLEVVYSDLESRLGKEKEWREVTVAFAAGGVLMLLLGGALSASWFRRLP